MTNFLRFDRQQLINFLNVFVETLDTNSLREALSRMIQKPLTVVDPVPKNEVVQEEPEMRTCDHENIMWLMKLKSIDWETAWTELRCKELEDGKSICCTEECSDREEAIEELVEAARRGKKKRNARRKATGQVSDDEASENSSYLAPPKVRDAEKFWPFMRCKIVAKAIQRNLFNQFPNVKTPPKNHHGLLEYIAAAAKVSVEDLKKTSPRYLFANHRPVLHALGYCSLYL